MVAAPILPVAVPSAHPAKAQGRKIEDFRPGYPRYTSLISSHGPFFLFRRFSRLRARLLLLKQDKLAVLEKQLDDIDDAEAFPIFLAKDETSYLSDEKDLFSLSPTLDSAAARFEDWIEDRLAQFFSHSKLAAMPRQIQTYIYTLANS
ncbi:unnamed protein product [Fusarium equiseti]|uniref:DUF6594 domain-containing protein n=1 Tax=Fusarium equiseti TaxID=61235 RepID=A0A8J2IKL0_FUSEQ|nr:unnamed protein product [Fusarium equiseti]